jgi:hypothetical protein
MNLNEIRCEGMNSTGLGHSPMAGLHELDDEALGSAEPEKYLTN